MIWLNAAALFGVAAVAAPVLIHLFVQRRAEPFPFPTLRFLRPTRLVSIRRHFIDDWPLLLVRCATLTVAAAAAAGPIMLTTARHERWSQRVVRAVVVDRTGADGSPAATSSTGPPAFRTREFQSATLRDGVHRAVAWLSGAPPARREIVMASRFAIGAFDAADIAAIPRDVGIRFERSAALPPARSVAFGRVLTADGTAERTLTLEAAATSVVERVIAETPQLPIDIVAPAAARPVLDAARSAVLAERVWAPAPGRRVRLVILEGSGTTLPSAGPVRAGWMADALAKIAGDPELQAAAGRIVTAPDGARLAAAPWTPFARAGDGGALASAAADDAVLIVASGAPAADVMTPVLVRALANALADVPDLRNAEVVAIGDDQLRAWSRPAVLPPVERLRNVDEDDRRWLWVAVLALLGIESWLRRAARSAGAESEAQRVA